MNKLALITGASGGLGRACADQLQAEGWQLTLVSRDTSKLTAFSEALLINADVSQPEAAQQAISTVMERYGSPPNALIQCAGNTLIAPLQRTPAEKYHECLRANLDTAFFTLQAFTGALAKAKAPGAAVLVSSVVAGMGVTNHAAIAAAKGGVEALVRSAAADYAPHRIRINAIAPGLMRSPMTEHMVASERGQAQIAAQYPLGRFGEIQDGAAAICWLLSEQASWITGQILPLDGGFSAIRPMVKN